VTELEIAEAKAEIGADGIGCEPASAVTLAGLKKLLRRGFVKQSETVILILTGICSKIRLHHQVPSRRSVPCNARRVPNRAVGPLQRAPVVLDADLAASSQPSPSPKQKFVAVLPDLVYKTRFRLFRCLEGPASAAPCRITQLS